MWAKVESGSVTQIYTSPKQITIGNVQYPSNIFELWTDAELKVIGIYPVVQDNANLRWLNDSVKHYGGDFFPDYKINLDKYINAGVVYLDNDSLSVYKHLRDFYFEHQEELDNWNKGGGREQTLFNFLLQINNYDVNLLPPIWNMFAMHKKEMFSHNWQDGDDKTPFFIKYSWVWHFTGFPIEDRTRIMKQTWDMVGKNYE